MLLLLLLLLPMLLPPELRRRVLRRRLCVFLPSPCLLLVKPKRCFQVVELILQCVLLL